MHRGLVGGTRDGVGVHPLLQATGFLDAGLGRFLHSPGFGGVSALVGHADLGLRPGHGRATKAQVQGRDALRARAQAELARRKNRSA